MIVIPLLVHHLFEIVASICRIKFLVAKLDQQYQAMDIAARGRLCRLPGNATLFLLFLQSVLGNHTLRYLLGCQLLEIDFIRCRAQLGITGYHLTGLSSTVGQQLGIPIITIGTTHDWNTIGCYSIMIKLITDHSNGNHRPIGLDYGLGNRPCRYGIQRGYPKQYTRNQ